MGQKEHGMQISLHGIFSHFRLEFDDTFHQIRLFQEQDIDSRLLVLATSLIYVIFI